MNTDYLSHHGIKGQKWGIRRFRKENGKLTDSGKKRYNVNISNRKQKLAMLQAKNADNPSDELFDKIRYHKNELANDKIKDRINRGKLNINTNGKFFNKKYQEYIKQGYSKEDAKIYAYRNDRARKVIIGAAGLTMATLAAYGGYRYYKNNIDGVIKAGSKLQNISSFDRDLKDAIYTSKGLDNLKYRGQYGFQMKLQNGFDGTPIFKNTYKATKDIKIASNKSARKVLSNIINADKDAKNITYERINQLHAAANVPNLGARLRMQYEITALKAEKELKSGKVGANVYKAFNIGLPQHDAANAKINKKFYDALKQAGYNAVRDINDDIYSGYKSKTATILFDTADKMNLDSKSTMSAAKIGRDMLGSTILIKAQQALPYSGLILGGGAIYSNREMTNAMNKNRKVVDNYKKKHPNTTKTDREILESNNST